MGNKRKAVLIAVAYKIDGDAQQAFSQLCAIISEYGAYTR